ncbi:MAG TPA: sensor histidine kinase N-terminal domain-containing protein [Accumulibacter sp.]|nr:sensor histidine kinase N-terminal domain-containing protein [Accumulibacter sp.]HMW18220.1 sensor histidine kinase N-terminal domain-containing protein [Accumulibacter sp.]HMX22844.1 sensor histidine kinase N-terminal domain-containing protein [Accumulibacter sp.]HMY05855.1 sensor histidine kinase N-terminal domain-containing protein [Accumulibacter sp.]HNC18347.1 sensor histidine kinase N-terminal domain-containing protein [Accumulibacter sp.]
MKNLRKKTSPDIQRSLFGEILDWMLAPLLFVWPISIAFTHYFANNVAGFPYDQALREKVRTLARQIEVTDGVAHLLAPAVAQSFLRSDETDSVYFHLLDEQGKRLAGDPELPLPKDFRKTITASSEQVTFREDEFRGQTLRIASLPVPLPTLQPTGWLLVEVGETTEKRSQLANKIIASVILPQFVIIPLAVVLVWFGLSQGLRPLTRLRDRIVARREADLSPIALRRVPEELRPLTEAFNAMLGRLQHNVAAQQRFIADAAHQLRTPLTGLKTQAQLAMRDSDPAELRHALRQILHGVNRASHLVDQLLTLARTEASGHAEQLLLPLDLQTVLREVVENWVPQALGKGIDLGYEPAGTVLINGNRFLLQELINNLLDNALRYTPRGGQVTARIVEQGDFALLEVEDNGSGIADDEALKVFERFYRVEGNDSEGSGLGLAIVREIAEVHQAAASLRPNTHRSTNDASPGCTARIVFPIHQQKALRPVIPEPVQTGFA